MHSRHGLADKPKARTLIYDIETAPIIGTVWQKYEADVIWSIQDWYMLGFAYKWLGERQTYVVALPDFRGYKPGTPNDINVVKSLHALFNEADIVVAHNGDKFDQKKTQARFIYHNLSPTQHYKSVDTLKVARKHFSFTSNKLDDLGEHLGLGRKLKTDKDLWRGCMAGDLQAWAKMKRYNKQDVILLEKLYLRLRPWTDNHPNMANIAGRPETCPRCGSDEGFQASGFKFTKTGRYRRFQCKACGTKVSERTKLKEEGPVYT